MRVLQELKGKVRVTGIFPAKTNSGERDVRFRQVTPCPCAACSKRRIVHACAVRDAAVHIWVALLRLPHC